MKPNNKILPLNQITSNDKNLKISKNSLVLVIIGINVLTFLFSVIESDYFVGHYLPASTLHFMLSGFTRKILDFSAFLANLFVFAILIFSQKELLSNSNQQLNKGLNPLQLRRLQRRNQLFKNVFRHVNTLLISGSIICVTLLIKLLSRKPLLFSIAIEFCFSSTAVFGLPPALALLHQIFAISFYFNLRIKRLKALLNLILLSRKKISIKKLLIDHNHLCRDIARFSKLVKVFYFLALFTMIPISLLMLHSILFGGLPYFLMFPVFAAFLISNAFVFVISYLLAKVSYRVHFQKRAFLKIFIRTLNMRFRDWVKFTTALEWMSYSNRKIGFNCLSIFTVTYSTLMKVVI